MALGRGKRRLAEKKTALRRIKNWGGVISYCPIQEAKMEILVSLESIHILGRASQAADEVF
ncbi:hypothetical protein SBA4_5930005 [Candidatus Sulfopaludibacter sp. SbA4]|nr:hypothetical protein SBA4_5930005 [Candidatus Sulfopaludibacter sp. SbA4]